MNIAANLLKDYRLKIWIMTIFLSIGLSSLPLKAQHKKDSLWAIWQNSTLHDTTRLNALDKMCIEINSISTPDSAIHLSEIAYQFAGKKNLKKYMAKAAGQKANAYKTKGDYFSALKYNKEALRLSEEAGYGKGVATSNTRIGICYMYWGDYPKAAHYFYKSLKYHEKTKDESNQAIALSNIANLYFRTDKKDSSIVILKRCLEIHSKLKDKKRMAEIYNTLGEYSYLLTKKDDLILYEEKAIKLWLELDNNPRGLASSYLNLSKAYQDKEDSTLAKQLILKAMAIHQEIGGRLGIALCEMNLGVMYYNFGNTPKAIELLKRSFEVYKSSGATETAEFLAYHLSKFYMEQNNMKEALKMQELQIAYKDSNYKSNAKSAIEHEEIKYDFEKKEEATRIEHEKTLALLELEAAKKDFRHNLWLAASIAFLFIVLLSSYFIYHHFKQKNIISVQKNNILKQQLLVSQMNPHFIFNSLNAVQNFIFRQDSYNAGIYLNKFSALIRMILDFSRKDLISLDDEFNFLQSYLELQKVRFDNKLNYELKIDPKLEREMVMIPPMLAQPFIENAIEHGIFYKNGEGFLSVKISLNKNTVLFEIEDDGIGMGESLKRKNGSVKKHHSLAIQITKERLETMNAHNKTEFEIEIKDKVLLHKETSGVYVKFAAPYLTL